MPPPELVVDYAPRRQFEAFHDRRQRFACIVTHRRAGKTVACIYDLQRAAVSSERLRPRFAYLSPFLKQSKTVAWDYLRAAMAPLRRLGATVHESELRVDYPKGGQVRLYGADNPDALRGIYLDGIVLDEYADMDPRVWSEIIRPALADRGGWAVFIGTPKGRNAFFELWRRAQSQADWFTLMLKASDTGLIPASELELAKRDLSEEQYAQEFECSFEAAVVGAYYGKLMVRAEEERRITGVPYDPAAPVWTAWDLGIRDATAIWFAQVIGREIRIIDYYEACGVDLGHYVRELAARPYVYAGHIVPHDAQAKELGTGKSRLEVLESLGLKNLQLAPMHRLEDGINAVRVFLPKCWFAATKCARGIDALKLYRAEYDDKLQALRPRPVHDWCFTGDTKVLTRYGMYPMKALPNQGKVLTPCGWRRYHSPRVTRRNARLVEVQFVGGHSVRCTPDHMFMTDSGWKSAESLQPGTPIQSSLTFSRSISMAACIAYGRVRDITRVAVRSCIAMFGNVLSAPSRRAAISIIGMVTPQTMRSPISSVCPQPSTYPRLGSGTEISVPRRVISRYGLARPLPIGTSPTPEGYGTGVMLSAQGGGLSGRGKVAPAIIVVRRFMRWCARAATASVFARLIAKPLLIESVASLADTDDVWCLTVPGEECFSLANGAVVHNCSHAADSFRYLALTLDRKATHSGFYRRIDYPQHGVV